MAERYRLAIEYVFGTETRHLRDFRQIRWTPGAYNISNADRAFERAFYVGRDTAQAVLASMLDEIDEYWAGIDSSESPTSAPARVEHLCNRFHIVARQLRSRREGRPTIDVDDEYDVQDLLHALLRVDFDDVRPEIWTPGYAGKSARVDFLLKEHSLIVEVKRARRGLGVKELGDQLIIDIARYKHHPDCQRLICFIYDPEGLIGNPASLERDLSGSHDALNVQVIVAPTNS